MRRGGAAALLLALCFAGALTPTLVRTPAAGADEGTTGTTTVPTTTGTTATDPTTTAPTTTVPPKPAPKVIAPGVTVGGLLVGGLTLAEATELLRERFAKPLVLVVSPTRRLRVTPRELGAVATIGAAARRARAYRAGAVVPLRVTVDRARVDGFVARLGRELDRDPVEARLVLRRLKPFATRDAPGRRLNRVLASRAVVRALKTHDREPLSLVFRETRPAASRESFKDVIVIKRGSNRLQYFVNLRLKRSFRVATGQSSYPTPLGRFEVTTKWRNPWWYPPSGSDWAAGKEPVPPGPGNPLGTRWMGISSPYVGIHGTPDAASIGYSASHGCIRMLIPEVEWLFQRVEVGTPVFIVRG